MPYTLPTVLQFETRFPEFAEVDDPRIAAFLVEANRSVDETWFEDDYQPAIMFLAAHKMTMEGLLSAEGSIATGSVSGPIKSESLGDASITYADRGGGSDYTGSDAEYALTPYGLEYIKLRRVNHPPILVL